jgi:hypothetical protein
MFLKTLSSRALMIAVCLSTSTTAFAQFGGLMGGGQKGPTVDPAKTLAAGANVIGYVSLATFLANDAADLLIDMYPPEKVAEIKKLSMQTAEAKAKTKEGDFDADQAKAFEDKSALLEKLQKEGALNDYKKEKSGNIAKAYSRLGLALLADGAAAIALPPTIDGLQKSVQQISKNPLQVLNSGKLVAQVATLTAVGVAIPKQVSAANTVRSICSQIATAEKVTLAADVSADRVKDLTAMKTASTTLE